MAVAKAACLVCVASAARAADSAVRRVVHAMVVSSSSWHSSAMRLARGMPTRGCA